MKAYILKESDFQALLTLIDRDPRHGQSGGSSRGGLSSVEQRFYDEAHGFYNYQVRRWIDDMQKE
ncbi:MAG: hypothetical protein E6Q97_22315 [Desulfurellales bacterium]|nr:MAG: hypothetical protein E6Q97_22315 [Desulfurellales bacterium]